MDTSNELIYITIIVLILLVIITFQNLNEYFKNEDSPDGEVRRKHHAVKFTSMYVTTLVVIFLTILGYILFRIGSCTKI